MTKTQAFQTFIAVLLAVVACNDSDSDKDTEHENPHGGEAEVCETFADAPTAITATTARESAPVLRPEDSPYRVSLAEADGAGYFGYVAIDGPGDWLLFSNLAAVVSSLHTEGNDTNLLADGAPSELCPQELPEHFDLELSPGRYILELGPSSEQELGLALASAEGHGE